MDILFPSQTPKKQKPSLSASDYTEPILSALGYLDFLKYGLGTYFTEEDLNNNLFIKIRNIELVHEIKVAVEASLNKSKSKNTIKPDNASKVIICIDTTKGIYLHTNPLVRYEIRGKRFEIVKLLLECEHLTLSDLHSKTDRPNYLISKEIKGINRAFKNLLKLKLDIIDHSDTSGFFLNREDYAIESYLN
jgi:hypothetical protein